MSVVFAASPRPASPPPATGGEGEGEAWPVEVLAARSGFTVRNIRAYTTAGLLPPPVLRGRLGLYDTGHLQRLDVIRALRAQGFGIEAIRRVFERAPTDSWRELVAVAQSVSSGLFADEAPQVVSAAALAAKWKGRMTPALMARATRAGLMRALPGGQVEMLSPALGRVADQLAALGLAPDQVIDMQEALVRSLRTLARRWLKTLVDALLADPAPDPVQVRGLLENARALATGAVQAAFPLILQQEFDALLARHERTPA